MRDKFRSPAKTIIFFPIPEYFLLSIFIERESLQATSLPGPPYRPSYRPGILTKRPSITTEVASWGDAFSLRP